MNKVLYQTVLNIIDEIKLKLPSVDYSKLCKTLGYTEEVLADYITSPQPNASLYLEILDNIDALMEVDNNDK